MMRGREASPPPNDLRNTVPVSGFPASGAPKTVCVVPKSLCGGAYVLVGNPKVSPRIQALVDARIVTLATDNPKLIRVVCEGTGRRQSLGNDFCVAHRPSN
jgi:hypothetical protein